MGEEEERGNGKRADGKARNRQVRTRLQLDAGNWERSKAGGWWAGADAGAGGSCRSEPGLASRSASNDGTLLVGDQKRWGYMGPSEPVLMRAANRSTGGLVGTHPTVLCHYNRHSEVIGQAGRPARLDMAWSKRQCLPVLAGAVVYGRGPSVRPAKHTVSDKLVARGAHRTLARAGFCVAELG